MAMAMAMAAAAAMPSRRRQPGFFDGRPGCTGQGHGLPRRWPAASARRLRWRRQGCGTGWQSAPREPWRCARHF